MPPIELQQTLRRPRYRITWYTMYTKRVDEAYQAFSLDMVIVANFHTSCWMANYVIIKSKTKDDEFMIRMSFKSFQKRQS